MEDSAHLRDVEATLATSPQADPEAAKKKLRDLAARRNP